MTRFEAAPSRHAQQRPRFACQGAIAGSKGYLLARLYAEQRVSLLIVAPDARQRDQLVDDLRCFLSGLPASTPTEPGFANQVLPYDHQVTASAASMTYQQH